MNEHKTGSILQRVPVILAVTAASYGLAGGSERRSSGNDRRPGDGKGAAEGRASAQGAGKR